MNGFGVRLEGLQPFVDALEPGTGVIRFDVPGIGGSSTPAAPYRMSGMSRLVARMLDVLGHPRADVLGASWGGTLAQQFAFQERRRCRRLILVSTTPGIAIPRHPSVLREMIPRPGLDGSERARAAASGIYAASIRSTLAAVGLLRHVRGDRRGYVYQQLAVLGWTSVRFARLIEQPTLIITGDKDRIISPINGRIMRRLLPNAELHVFHGGHLGLITSAGALAPMIEDFLDRE
jgi:poly(3-hydroxyalkanoate) depolymerase